MEGLPKQIVFKRRRTFGGLSTKFCFFSFGFIFGFFISLAFLAYFQYSFNEEMSRNAKSMKTLNEMTTQSLITNYNKSEEQVIKTTPNTEELTISTQFTTNRLIEETTEETSTEEVLKTSLKQVLEETTDTPMEELTTLPLKTTTVSKKTSLDETRLVTRDLSHFTTEETKEETFNVFNNTLIENNNSSESSSENSSQNTTLFENKSTSLTTDSSMTSLDNTTESEINNTSINSRVFHNFNNNSVFIELNSTLINETKEENSSLINNSSEEEELCLSSQFKCNQSSDNKCFSKQLLCDNQEDCPLGEDERDCLENNCFLNFKCGNNSCIKRDQYCDGLWDCPEGEDELNCSVNECQKGEFLCKDLRKCIKGKQACDHVSNCQDHSDEIGCVNSLECQLKQGFYCNNGLCIDRALKCDHINDCPEGEDEKDCQTLDSCLEGFLCSSGECLSEDKRCDGQQDCADDEFLCFALSESNSVLLLNNNNWIPLCFQQNFTSEEGDLLCRELGFFSSKNFSKTIVNPLKGLFASKDKQILNYCFNNESLVLECQQKQCGEQNQTDVTPSPLLLSDGHESCAAHAIAADWLLSSASCLTSLNESSLVLKDNEIKHVIKHQKFSKFRSPRIPDFDFVLIQTKLVINSSPLICLPPDQLEQGITCFSKEQITLEVFDKSLCNSSKHLNKQLTSRHLCTHSTTNNKCLERGSPLNCLSSDSHWYLGGFLLFDYCLPNSHVIHPKVFSNVFSVKQWIESAIGRQYQTVRDSQVFQELNPNFIIAINETIVYLNQTLFNETQIFDNISDYSLLKDSLNEESLDLKTNSSLSFNQTSLNDSISDESLIHSSNIQINKSIAFDNQQSNNETLFN